MCRAIGVEPTKLTALIRGSSRIRSTVSLSPLTTLSTPSGRPASRKASASHRAAEGDFFAGLEDDSVAGGDGGGDHPQRDHGGEVERGDAGDHADGLAQLGDVDAGGGLFEGFAFHVVDQAGAEFDVLEAAGDLAVGVVEDLAVFGGDDRGEFAAAGGDDLAEVEHDVRALGHAGGPPGGGGGFGGVDGGGEGGGVGEGDLAGLDAGGGVVHRAGAVTCGGGVPTDEMVERRNVVEGAGHVTSFGSGPTVVSPGTLRVVRSAVGCRSVAQLTCD
jgi:hypothetical protein